jgi:hypothetical protein
MAKRFFQTGSKKAKFLKLVRFLWLNIGKFGKVSLAGILNTSKKSFKWLTHLNWVKLLEAIKLVVEILKNIRSLLFCDQTAHFVQVAG